MFNIKIDKKAKDMIFIAALVLAILITISINLVMGIETVYTHLFYIPIILAGIWYHKKAVYVAVFLGLIHIVANYSLHYELAYSPIVRAAIFVITAYTIGMIAEKKDEILDRLKASEGYLKILYNVLEQSPNSVVMTDEKGRITYINSKCSRVVGRSRAEVVGADASAALSDYPLYAGNKPDAEPGREYESQVTYSDGSIHWINSVVSPIRNDSGVITHTVQIDSDITGRKLAEIALKDSEERYRRLISIAQESILTIDYDGTITFANPFAEKMLGYSADALVKRSIFDFVDGQSKEKFSELLKNSTAEARDEHIVLNPKSGEQIYAGVKISPLYEGTGNGSTLLLLADITDRIKKQESLNTSLQEKDALLKEIHHRVKNNLQIISSLVNLQSSEISDSKAVSALNETQARIKTMALIHEKMYRSMDLSNIDLAEYIANLTRALFSIYNTAQSRIRLNLDMEKGVKIDIDTAVPCGLIINELVSNCLKHAFPDGREGEIIVEMSKTEKIVSLTVRDNGVGIPPGLDVRNTETLGMQLVYTLAAQLEGTVTLKSENGTTFIIEYLVK
ncbi:sensor histidine kinase [Methanocella sp. MCL-LM]|uniref:sensor histidine kinase n=1 Tax=Methanocella sp. MCL-LM TaxID=3412035 RepID=UPI003C788E42